MKLTCLSKGNGVHFPPCHMLELCGFSLLLECPIDLSAIDVFTPTISSSSQHVPLGLINAEPWYKAAKNLHLWDISLIDVVLISTPAGMLGLPFLTKNPRFSAKVYATEATMMIGHLMMDDIVSMHAEYVQFYGHGRIPFPEWMRWAELEKLPLKLKEIVIGEDGNELGCWLPLYSAAEINACMDLVQPVKYAEEVCFNSTFVLKAFSSGLEIGSCNWKINAPRRSIAYLSSSIFESAQAMEFDYRALQGADLILFSDLSATNALEDDFCLIGGSNSNINNVDKDLISINTSIPGTMMAEVDEVVTFLMDNSDILEESDKMNFILSSIMDSVREGGSILIPIGRFGIVFQLLEQISALLESSSLEVPIFMISTTAEQTLAFTNTIPEWLCKKRQQKLFSGEPLFGNVNLLKEKKLHAFPLLYSSDLLLAWQEPCIVFAPHWTLRLGPAIHLLNRWHLDPRCLLILEQELDAELALSPFKMVSMKVLQCSFLSGIRAHKIFPLLRMLKPKLVLVHSLNPYHHLLPPSQLTLNEALIVSSLFLPLQFHEDLRPLCTSQPSNNSFSILFYSMNSTLHVPNPQDHIEGWLMTDLAVQLQPIKLTSKDMAIARLRAKLVLNKGRFLVVSPRKPYLPNLRLLLCSSVDAVRLLAVLTEKGLDCSIETSKNESTLTDFDAQSVRILVSEDVVIETSSTKTVISAGDESLARLIHETLSGTCDGI